ncbi:MAG: HAD family hydrolase [Dokdonella sp.]|uniref:HAD family hydrolase n=1 Tax=Dokdonella sp. TaxID=2291710 RepID=UPI0025BCEB9C|nr:HAD family hydrolase [Dokdonella sp.]MBZ0223193.1 HAD family hydrolase [Dokdonella sp.]
MIELIGFDGDDTLWHSEGFYQHAGAEFERIVGQYIDVGDALVRARLNAAERSNLALFGYGAKSMALSMVEAAIELTDGRINAADIHRIIALAKSLLEHPVELLPGIAAAVAAVAARHRIVLITKGDLFHQERKIEQSGLSDLFQRIEIVSEKDTRRYAQVLAEFDVAPSRFAMVGNSLRSDIEPVIELGGWGIHMPYHVTWEHELEHGVDVAHPRLTTITNAEGIAAALAMCERAAKVCDAT